MKNPIELLQRNSFFDGQRLFASDFHGMEFYQRTMRQLHNLSLHQPGIGSGFAVSGQDGDREIVVGPGYAIDAQGREIVNTQTRRIPIPTVHADVDGKPVGFYLVVSYKNEDHLEALETRESVCSQSVCEPYGTVRVQEDPDFCWVRLARDGDSFRPEDAQLDDAIEGGHKIVLTGIEVLECKLHRLSIEKRRNARPETQPYVRCGKSKQPQWEILNGHIFNERDANADNVPGAQSNLSLIFFLVEAEIDTSQVGFVNSPCYSVQLEGNRIVVRKKERGDPELYILEGLASIREPTADGFKVQVMAFAATERLFPPEYVSEFQNKLRDKNSEEYKEWLPLFDNWTVVWMGSE